MRRYLTETLYFYWRRWRDAVLGFVSQPALAPMPEPCDRAGLFHQLTELRACRAEEVRRAQHDIEALTRELLPAQATVETLRRALAALHADQLCKSLQSTTAEGKILVELEGKTSTSLVLFIQELDSELQHLYRKAPTAVPGVQRDYVAMKTRPTIQTDGPSIQRRVQALLIARRRAEAMRYELLTIVEMNTQLIQLRKSLPDVIPEELTGHRAAVLAAN